MFDRQEGVVTHLHDGSSPVSSLSFSEHRSMVLIGLSAGGAILMTESGEPVATLSSEESCTMGIAFEDGLVLTRNDWERVLLWRSHQGRLPEALPLTDEEGARRHASFVGRAFDGSVVLMSGFAWMLLDPMTMQSRRSFDLGHLDLPDFPDGLTGLSRTGRFAYHYWDQHLVWSTATGEPITKARRKFDCFCAALSDNGRFLALGDKQGNVRVLGPDANQVYLVNKSPATVKRIAIDDHGQTVAWLDRNGRFGWVAIESGAEILNPDEAAERFFGP